jgi:murein DD-endopeptidase MepM/ murein hydrolase activator NlpD
VTANLFRIVLAIAALAAALPAAAKDRVRLRGPIAQGALVFGYTAPGTAVSVDGRTLRVTKRGRFVFGIGRDRKTPVALALAYPDGTRETRDLKVRPRKWRIQRITGVPERLVTPPPEVMARLEREYKLMVDARKVDSGRTDWTGKPIWPARGRITGVFGSQRVYNGKPRAYHSGVDVGIGRGTPVRAPLGGVVTLTHEGMYFAGKSVVIDHGYGVNSTFIHLSKILVKPGQRVRKGEVVGLSGMTGRATGPHLHWSLAWFQTRVDPQPVVGPMPRPKTRSKQGAAQRSK